jgi:calcium homeostasis endoplasmic reticulum protein
MNTVNLIPPQNRNEIIQNMFNSQSFKNQQHNFPNHPQLHHVQQQDANNQFQNFNLPPPNFSIPDLSRPPPGFNSSAENSPPQAEPIEEPDPQPFFALPAGLMVPLIRLEDCSYRGLETELIRQPAPTAPTEKLLSAVEAFYSAPSHERPRDTEGWEKLGLYEYFKMKNAVRKQKEEAIMKGERQKSKSPSPIPDSYTKPMKKQRKRVYSSKSPENRSSKSKSRSVTPPESRPVATPSTNRTRSRKRSRSPSPTPYRSFNRDTRVDRRKRSVTPPSFMGATPKAATEFIDEGNKGHQMLKKLGWKKETGLGFNNQGIAEPISGGEIRDRNDLYKVRSKSSPPTHAILMQIHFFFYLHQGVGMNTNDPYENFRRNRSTNFIVRMKSKGDDKH